MADYNGLRSNAEMENALTAGHTITPAKATLLVSNGNTTVHYHDADRDMDNAVESATKKVLTSTERNKLSNISVTQAVDLDVIESASHAIATVSDSTTVDLTLAGQNIEAAVIAVPNEATGVLKFWTGTQAAYDLLTPAATTLYFIEE